MCSFESCSRNLHKCINENRTCLQGCSTELIERLQVDTNDLIKNTKGVFEYNSLNPQSLASALIDLSNIYHKKSSISSISTSISSQVRLSELKKPSATVGHLQLQSNQQQYHQIILQHQQSSTRLSLADILTPYSTTDTFVKETTKNPTIKLTSMIGNSVSSPAVFPAIDQYRLQLYNYAMVERLRCVQYPGSLPFCPPNFQGITPIGNSYGPRFALSMSLFHNRAFQPEEPKPQHSYIGLIAMAILSSPEAKLVLSDIYQHILDNYPYFRTRGPGWRNSIRHNLSLNDCFIKAGRSANGKGHYWAIHPANIEDFKKGDFRRRKAQRKVRRHMGLAVDDEGTDSPSPPLLSVTPPSQSSPPLPPTSLQTSWDATTQNRSSTHSMLHTHSQSRKRQFDVASLLAPDEDHNLPRIQQQNIYTLQQRYFQSQDHSTLHYTGHTENLEIKAPETKRLLSSHSSDEDIDVEASDVEDIDGISKVKISDIHSLFAKRESTLRTVERHNRLRQKTFPEVDKDDQIISREEKFSESPTMVHVDATIHNQLTTPSPSSSIYFQDVMQKWPSSFSALGIKAMDPRIFGRYYGQCVAAAASKRVSVVGSLLNAKTNTNSKFTSTGEIDNIDQREHLQ